MTICFIEVGPDTLSRLATSQHVIELCRQVCMQILLYFQTVEFRGRPELQQEILDLNFTLQWCLGLLRGTATDASIVDIPVIVQRIYVHKKGVNRLLSVREDFPMEELNRVPLDVLTRIMLKLINDSVAAILPKLGGLHHHRLATCLTALSSIPRKVKRLCNNTQIRGRLNDKIRLSIRVEYVDQNDEVKVLA